MELKFNIQTGVGLLCVVYLLNLGVGIFEILPDYLPFIGNLDELFAAGLAIKLLKIDLKWLKD